MKLESDSDTLVVTELTELAAPNATEVREAIRAALTPAHKTILIDLSHISFLDSSGLGALVALHKTMLTGGGRVKLLNPTPIAQQALRLTRLHRILEVVLHR